MIRLRLHHLCAVAVCAAAIGMTACSNQQPSDEQVKQKAAETTEQVKAGAKQAAADAKVAAANAERKINDVAAGVKDGLKSNTKPAAGTININSAPERQLIDLPGITDVRAKRIIRGRPYAATADLVSKGILTQAQYDRIAGQITAQ